MHGVMLPVPDLKNEYEQIAAEIREACLMGDARDAIAPHGYVTIVLAAVVAGDDDLPEVMSSCQGTSSSS